MQEQVNLLIKLDETQYQTPDLSKKGTIAAASNIYKGIVDDGLSAIQVAELFKFIEETYKQLKDMTDLEGKNTFTSLVRDEILRNSNDGKGCNSKYGTAFEITEAGTKYDYSVCGDPVWNRLTSEAKAIKEKLAERETYLKTIKRLTPVGNIIDEDTSELHENVELYPPIKTSTSTFKQTMLKG